MIDLLNNTAEQILRDMSDSKTNIVTSQNGLNLICGVTPSKTTLYKIELIAKFLSVNCEQIMEGEDYLDLIFALKSKLIAEAVGESRVIQKVNELSCASIGGSSSDITIVISPAKPISVIKFGLVFESKDQIGNTAMDMAVKKLLMHKTPVIVNREFMLAHRHRFFDFQIPLQWHHQKTGNYCLILPEGVGNPGDFGFNEGELIQGSFKKLLPLTTDESALERLFVNETSERKFARVGFMAGHGSPQTGEHEGTIAGLPLGQFSKVQEILHEKGMKFGILVSCFSGGSNIETIQKTPYPLIIMSSSEQVTIENMFAPSVDGFLEYAKNCLQNPNLQEIPLDIESLVGNEAVSQIVKRLPAENLPTIVLPNTNGNANLGLIDSHGMKRLQRRMLSQPIILEGDKNRVGFISPGGTGYHILKEVISENVPLETIAENTFSLLNLSNSSTEKSIFIRQMKCPLDKEKNDLENFEKVVMFVSSNEKILLFSPSSDGMHYARTKDISGKGWTKYAWREPQALLCYYLCFARTMKSKGYDALASLLDFQKEFFGDIASSPFHEIFATLIRASCCGESESYVELFQSQLEGVKEKYPHELFLIRSFIQNLGLNSYLDLINKTFAPEIWDRSAFFEACREGDAELAKRILKVSGSEELDPETVAFSLPHALASERSEDILKFLMGRINHSQGDMSGVIRFLILNSLTHWLEHLLKQAQGISKEVLSLALAIAINKKDRKSLEILLSNGADPNICNCIGEFPLTFLCRLSPDPEQIEMLQLFIKWDAEVNVVTKEEETPLLIALVKRNFPLIESLIKNGASFSRGEFERICLDPELMNFVLEHSTLEQLEKNASVHPLITALRRENLELAEGLINKGVKWSKDFVIEYLFKMGTNADVKVLDWIISQEELQEPTELNFHKILSNAYQNSSLDVIQHLEKTFQRKYGVDVRKWVCMVEYLYLHGALTHKYMSEEFQNKDYAIASDKKALAEARYGSQENIEKVIRHCIDGISNFVGVFLTNQNQFLGESNKELRIYFLNAVIRKSPFKTFYTALQEGDIKQVQGYIQQFSEQDIVQIWKYCPPSAILMELGKPSEELVRIVFSQMDKAALHDMEEGHRNAILSDMFALSENYPDLRLQFQTS